MFQNMQVANQPVFYLFIAFTLLLSLGYSWGKRKNKKIYLSVFNSIVNIVNPKDQNFTNIGGLTGYHANIVPSNNKIIKQIDLTLTLLPRQSWLYLPFSFIISHSDKLFANIYINKNRKYNFKEAHIVEKKFSKTALGTISNKENFKVEELLLNGKPYIIYTQDEHTRKYLDIFIQNLSEPSVLKHLAIIPNENKVYFFIIPETKYIKDIFNNIYKWVLSVCEKNTTI